MLRIAVGHSEAFATDQAVDELLVQCQQQLRELRPQAGILFAGCHYDHQQILSRLNKAFPDIELAGCTTDGEVSSTAGFQEDSITLMLFFSDTIECRVGIGRDLSKDLNTAVQSATRNAISRCRQEPKLGLLFCESLTTNGSQVLKLIQQELGESFPVIGGLAADQWRFERTYQFSREGVMRDGVLLLLFAGPVEFSTGIASGWEPVGRQGRVTQAQGNVVHTIDHQSALRFYRHYLGDHSHPSGSHPLAVYNNGSAANGYYLRAPLAYNEDNESIIFAGDVPANAMVQLTSALREQILEASAASIKQAIDSYPTKSQPQLGFMISCAARKQVLGTRAKEEIALLRQQAPQLPVIGWYSYGEIGPCQAKRTPQIHNETIITLLLGEGQ